MHKEQKVRSIAKKTMKSMAIRIAIVIGLSTVATYFHMSNVLTKQQLAQLESYVKERSEREANLFKLAQSNHDTMLIRLRDALRAPYVGDVETDFNALFLLNSDGTWRDRDPNIDTTSYPTFYHGKHVPLTTELKKRLLIGRQFFTQYSRAYEKQFADTYMTTPENSMLLFWPGQNWGAGAPSDLDMRKEEYVTVADPINNPERTTKWTGMYFDVSVNVWMLSIETPLYENDRILATIGHDILLTEILDRTIGESLPGGRNLIIREDGRLIAHPELMDKIKDSGGKLNVSAELSGLSDLNRVFQGIKKLDGEETIFWDNVSRKYYGHRFISGPNWHFLVEYPESVITALATDAASFIMIVGVIALLGEILILFRVITQMVGRPLRALSDDAENVSSGNFSARSKINSDDEIGVLARTFNTMLNVIEDREAKLQGHANELESKVIDRTATLEKQREQMIVSSKMASLGIMAGGIAHEINNPLAVIHGNAGRLIRLSNKQNLEKDSVIQVAETIIKTADRIAGIVKGLRSFARDGAADPIQPVKCKEVIAECLMFCGERFKNHNIKVEVSISNPDLIINCREVQIIQVLVNLLNNATDAIESRSDRWVKIICETIEGRTLIRVRDSGDGIPEDTLDRLMTPFFTTKEPGKGTGLGLSISYTILEAHHAKFYVNQKCSNTEFVIDFPNADSSTKPNSEMIAA